MIRTKVYEGLNERFWFTSELNHKNVSEVRFLIIRGFRDFILCVKKRV